MISKLNKCFKGVDKTPFLINTVRVLLNTIFIMFLKVLAVYSLIAFLLVGYASNKFQHSPIVKTLSERVN